MVWLALVPTTVGPVGADEQGILAYAGLLTAGWRLETAVPEVVTMAAHRGWHRSEREQRAAPGAR